ncbi:hypothetical protein NA78x_004297 [Anatilimnocola sp. NA78]|uniref:hypothetical protein n=1 Tax=Anatilimnocola sp. NA78 TaxID=3415683 RepID=UPI003CE54A16
MPTTPHAPAPLGPPQFGLRAMLLGVTCVAVLLALSQWFSPITIAALAFLLLTIAAHIAGNVIGTRLRTGQATAANHPEHSHTTLREDHFAPVSKLGQQHSLGWLPLLSALGGFLLGAAIGGVWTAMLLNPKLDVFTIGVAAFAFGALGGFGGFLIVGFIKAGWDAWQEAASHTAVHHENDQPKD